MLRASFTVLAGALLLSVLACPQSRTEPPRESAPSEVTGSGWQTLTAEERHVVEACGTERPFSGKWLKHGGKGTYTCTRCGAPLFSSDTKFDSGTGWPSFDRGLEGAVREVRDSDGRRVEIRCARCDGHLGHVFRGEGYTSQDTRHCTNSLSLDFAAGPREEAFFAGGCFWGVEHLLEDVPGVLNAESGYMGGHAQRPTYRQVTSGSTGHAEAVRILFDPTVVSYEALAKLFFEIHDPTQVDRQGPDVGNQYRSAVFVTGPKQGKITRRLIDVLEKSGLDVATKVAPAGVFWPAEAYHQDYYDRKGTEPYCHARTKRF